MKKYLEYLRKALKDPVIAMLASMLIGAILIIIIKENPLRVYMILLKGAFGSIKDVAGTLLQATPIMISGAAACLAFKSGIFNIGIEGQLYMGGFAAAYLGFAYNLPPVLHTIVALIASMIAGMLWIFLPALFRAKYNTNEVVSTILLNYVAVLITSFLTINVFKIPGGWSETPPVAETAYLPHLFSFSRLNLGFVIAIFIIVAMVLYFKKTKSGYECIATGSNYSYAEYGGILTKKVMMRVMLSSGAIAGLAGGIEALGVHRRFMEGFAPGFGFDGVTAALLAASNPIGTAITALFFGALRSGSLLMEVETNISREVITVIQAFIILFISVNIVIKKRKSKGGQK